MVNHELNIEFVEEVEKHPILYNFNLPGYSRKDQSDKVWQEVAVKFNLTAHDAKEKWRNLRTVFMRKLKASISGSGKYKRAYYLYNAMQFCVPYIKAMAPPSHETPEEISKAKEMCKREHQAPPSQPPWHGNVPGITQIKVFDEDLQQTHPPLPPLSPHLIETSSPSSPSEASSNGIPLPLAYASTPHSESARAKRKSNIMEQWAEVDKSVADYFNAKKAKLEAEDAVPDKMEALKLFLLSLMPELTDFSDQQIKIFKRKVFNVIDEISAASDMSTQLPQTGAPPDNQP